jgi:uncharacterized protein (DUF2141 family)
MAMKIGYYITLIGLVISYGYLFAQQENISLPAHGDLRVFISECKSNQGTVKIALCNSEDNFKLRYESFRSDTAGIDQNRAEVVFKRIPYGDYAVKVFHDENDDGKLNTNFLGLPTEVYGFSNNARGLYGPASWSAAKFKFETALDTILIELK